MAAEALDPGAGWAAARRFEVQMSDSEGRVSAGGGGDAGHPQEGAARAPVEGGCRRAGGSEGAEGKEVAPDNYAEVSLIRMKSSCVPPLSG